MSNRQQPAAAGVEEQEEGEGVEAAASNATGVEEREPRNHRVSKAHIAQDEREEHEARDEHGVHEAGEQPPAGVEERELRNHGFGKEHVAGEDVVRETASSQTQPR